MAKNGATEALGPVYTTSEIFKIAAITIHFGFAIEENSGRERTVLSRCYRFKKAPISKRFPSTKPAFSNISGYRKAPFL